MRAGIVLLMALAAGAEPAMGQGLQFDLVGVAVTDRGDAPTGVEPGSGVGVGGAVAAHLGRFAVEGRAYTVGLSSSEGGNERDVRQFALRSRVGILPVLAIEASVVHRSFDPDPEGTGVGFVSAGIRSDFDVAGRGRFWGRVAYIPVTGFSGGGSASFAVEAGLGFALAVIRERVLVTGRYNFQRIDRRIEGIPTRLEESKTSIELDVVEIGIAVTLGRRQGSTRETGAQQ